MLQQMRKLPKWVAGIAFLPLIVSFGVWGIGDIFRGNTDTSVATVGGTKIAYDDFTRALNNVRRQATRALGGQIPPARMSELGHEALQREVGDTALDNVANDLGLVTTDDQVSSVIRSLPQFHGPLGAFDETTFRSVISQMNFSEAGFVAEMRREMTRDQLITAGTAAFVLPPDYTHAFFAFVNERRAVQYIVLPPDAAGAIPPPSDQVLQAFVKANAREFSTPEYRELTYATISPDDVANQVQVTDAQLHQTYDLRRDTYVIPDRRDIQRITFPDEASAKAARAKIDAGAKFEDIAAQRGVSASELNLGSLSQADLGAIQGPAAFALPPDGVSQPLKYTFGWALLRVTKITPGSSKTFDDVKADLKAELVKQLASSKLEDIVNAFNDARNSGDDLAQAAKKVGMRVIHVPATDAQGLAPAGAKANVPADPEFLDQVFKSDIGTEGDPFATKDGNRFVLKVDSVTPTKLKSLDAVRAQAIAAWTDTQRRIKLAALADDLAQKVDSSASLLSIAGQYHVSVQSSGALSRGTPTAQIDMRLNQLIFGSAPGKAVSGPSANGNSFIIARISGVIHPDAPLGDPRYATFAQSIGNRVGNDIQAGMAATARTNQGVKINQQQADRAIGGEGS